MTMSTRTAIASLLAVCSLSCIVTSTLGDGNEPGPSKADGSDAADSPAPKPNAEPPVAEPLPDCPTDESALTVYCTDSGKLAGKWVPVDTLRIPDDVEIIFNAEGPDTVRRSSLMIATRGDELYIAHATCRGCRRVLGQGFAGHLSHMSEAQLRELQTRLGLGVETPLLASNGAWASFCSDETGKLALSQIAADTQLGDDER